jgi:hypothetical protein
MSAALKPILTLTRTRVSPVAWLTAVVWDGFEINSAFIDINPVYRGFAYCPITNKPHS